MKGTMEGFGNVLANGANSILNTREFYFVIHVQSLCLCWYSFTFNYLRTHFDATWQPNWNKKKVELNNMFLLSNFMTI